MDYTVKNIRATGANNVISVQCPGYSGDCTVYTSNPITSGNGANIVYELHIYATASQIDSKLSVNLPLIVSETAVINEPAYYLYESDSDFAHLVSVCTDKNIPYAGWSFDEACAPTMIEGSATNDNNCGADNDLSVHTTWGTTFFGF